MRIAVDTGGTFTDLVLEDASGGLTMYKAPTTPSDPIIGLLRAIDLAALDMRMGRDELLGQTDLFLHGTTRAINAILTGKTAKTAFLTTQGHPDILLFREGGREHPFNFKRPYPPPYIPRALTYEVPERIGSSGEIVKPLDEGRIVEIARGIAEQQIEAVAVCLLWSIINPQHELRIGELLDQHLPGIPYTLSHLLNPTLREYRRASSAAIDASLKPVMVEYLDSLEGRLRSAGFAGRLLVVTSGGGVLDGAAIAAAPIHSIGSGPAMAPVAGRFYAGMDAGATTAVIADTGGTTYDVSLVRRGRIPSTRETWLGGPYLGHMTGFPAVDVKSIGAGGGSIAWVDEGGLLRIGPESAGAVPGPACYGRGGRRPTVTDASLALGYIDPAYFLGGTMELDPEAARTALEGEIGARLGLDVHETAAAILKLATEHMVRAIEEITVNQGIDPRTAVLVGGGGAAGLNCVAIARRLGCPKVIIPALGAVLSAAGALMSDLTRDFGTMFRTTSVRFDFDAVNAILSDLAEKCRMFIATAGFGAIESAVDFSAEARYPHQIWELDVPLRVDRFSTEEDVEQLRSDFHELHTDIFTIQDSESSVEIVGWKARARCRLRNPESRVVGSRGRELLTADARRVFFPETGFIEAQVHHFDAMSPGVMVKGPVIVESPVTTVVIDPGASVERLSTGSLSILPATVS